MGNLVEAPKAGHVRAIDTLFLVSDTVTVNVMYLKAKYSDSKKNYAFRKLV